MAIRIESLQSKQKSLAVIGLGYVGLPLALEFGKHFDVIGYDIEESRIQQLKQRIDPSNEMSAESFEGRSVRFSSDPADLKNVGFFIVAVPTPVDDYKVPDLGPVLDASALIGNAIEAGAYVVYESTVYPGCTEEDCLPIVERNSGLKAGVDFNYGYSPERIDPGNKLKNVTNILKIVSGNNEEALDTIALVYETIVKAGIYRAPSVKVAEAAKVIENTQRDVNISLVNELSMIFDRMGIDTQEVIEAAATKWNFVKLFPGLVGGHCISVDPYYLLHKAKSLGYDPQVILSGRRINDEMPAYITNKLVQTLTQHGKAPHQSKVLVLGITFKENVADIRNSKVINLVREMRAYAIQVDVMDPHASSEELEKHYYIKLTEQMADSYDAIIIAVSHKEYLEKDMSYYLSKSRGKPIIFDLKGIFKSAKSSDEMVYWRL
ncbi:MAG: nucleotide sugar dehydrogenase [Saprospiraceae bacterium]